jgi:predicted HD phosphohydrolase
MVLTVAQSFGFVRETNYGRLFDVRIEPAPGNLAFTSREILPHTDNPYREPVPTVQLLHCLRAADEGGDTGLVDGFAAARALQAQDQAAYEIMTSTTVSFEYADKAHRVQRDRKPAPARLLRGHGRPGEHARDPQEEPVIDELNDLFAGPGAGEYLGEDVTIGVHMRQAGALAQAAGAPDALVAGALLHDVGHLRAETNARHGDKGADWLSRWFGPQVTEPVRLHVAAKRYLCATEPGYFGALSAESVRTLGLQGGPMSEEEATAFRLRDYALDAVAVRRWDDQAKEPSVAPPEFGHFAPLLARLLMPPPAAAAGGTAR